MPVNIHGKQYATVNERVAQFHEDCPNGCIHTSIVSHENGRIIFQAMVCPDLENEKRYFVGHAYEDEGKTQINSTSYLENCETSAIGRALAAAGYGVDAAFASANEVQQAVHQQDTPQKPQNSPSEASKPKREVVRRSDLEKAASRPSQETIARVSREMMAEQAEKAGKSAGQKGPDEYRDDIGMMVEELEAGGFMPKASCGEILQNLTACKYTDKKTGEAKEFPGYTDPLRISDKAAGINHKKVMDVYERFMANSAQQNQEQSVDAVKDNAEDDDNLPF